MSDMNDRPLFAADEADGVRPEAAPTVDETPPAPAAEHPPVGTNGTHDDPTWRNEAGRKGAKRVHQLIEAGRLYEREHGLKSGRQRLRQLIELGKRYEEEHGVRPVGKKRQGKRLSRAERDEVLATLLACLVKIAKPSFRAELARLASTLSNVEKGQAA
jgi:truncated hemoglobin YjbI